MKVNLFLNLFSRTYFGSQQKKNQNPFPWIENPSLPFQFSTFYLQNQWDYKERPNTSIIYVQVIVLLFSLEVLSSQAWTQNWVWLTRSNIHTSNTTYIVHTRCLMVSTDQADSRCFYFRISWILMERHSFYFFCPLHLVQGLRSNNIK